MARQERAVPEISRHFYRVLGRRGSLSRQACNLRPAIRSVQGSGIIMDTMKNCPGGQKPLAPNSQDRLCFFLIESVDGVNLRQSHVAKRLSPRWPRR